MFVVYPHLFLSAVWAHHKITPVRKSVHGLALRELSKILRFHFTVYTMAEARDFEYGTQLAFAKAQWKSGRGLGLGKLPYIWGSL